MQTSRSVVPVVVLSALLGGLAGVPRAQEPTLPAATSPGKVKALVAALQAKKLEAFSTRDPDADKRYLAVLHVPGAQLLVVAATHGRPTDIEYYMYRKEHMNAYMDLNSSVLSTDKIFIEDALADGLVARPAKDQAADSITLAGKPMAFDGEFADPKKRNDKRMPMADYAKAFADADARYAKFLDRLLAEVQR